jgi:hypothetical protein
MAATTSQQVAVLGQYKSGVVPGTNEHGVFAVQMIDGGVRIICEAPLISLPAPGDQVIDLMSAFDSLSAEDQEKFWNLDPAKPSTSALLTEMDREITPKLIALTEVAYTEEEKRILDGRFAQLGKSTQCYRIAACWHNTRYSLVSHIPYECYPLPEGTLISGLFIETAQLRHSCVPNCFARIQSDKGVMTVHTMRPIAAGEELTINTIDIYYNTVDVRAADLHARFGTTCACEACNPSHPKFKKHEDCRLANYNRAIQVDNFCTRINIIDHASVRIDLCLQDRDLPHPNFPITIEDLRDAEHTVLALIKGLKDTGCGSPELIRWYNALIDRIQPRVAHVLDNDEERVRYWRIMLRHAIECEKISGKCFGADSAEVQWAGARRAKMEGLIERAKMHQTWLEESKKKILG